MRVSRYAIICQKDISVAQNVVYLFKKPNNLMRLDRSFSHEIKFSLNSIKTKEEMLFCGFRYFIDQKPGLSETCDCRLQLDMPGCCCTLRYDNFDSLFWDLFASFENMRCILGQFYIIFYIFLTSQATLL